MSAARRLELGGFFRTARLEFFPLPVAPNFLLHCPFSRSRFFFFFFYYSPATPFCSVAFSSPKISPFCVSSFPFPARLCRLPLSPSRPLTPLLPLSPSRLLTPPPPLCSLSFWFAFCARSRVHPVRRRSDRVADPLHAPAHALSVSFPFFSPCRRISLCRSHGRALSPPRFFFCYFSLSHSFVRSFHLRGFFFSSSLFSSFFPRCRRRATAFSLLQRPDGMQRPPLHLQAAGGRLAEKREGAHR